MRRTLLLTGMMCLWGCATVAVAPLKKTDFAKFGIPARIVVAGTNATPETRTKVRELAGRFAAAGFSVATQEYVNGMLSVYGFNLGDLVNTGNFTALRGITRLDGVVLVREFYGTEAHVIDVVTGREIASGCWRTSAVTVVDEIIEQIKNKSVSLRQCPVKIE